MKIKDLIFCDDIRTEINNKFSLMGIYNERIVFKFDSKEKEVWPLPVKLCLMTRIENPDANKTVDKFEFTYKLNDKMFPSFSGPIVLEKPQSIITINVIANGLPLEKGILSFNLKLFSDDQVVFEVNEASALRIECEVDGLLMN